MPDRFVGLIRDWVRHICLNWTTICLSHASSPPPSEQAILKRRCGTCAGGLAMVRRRCWQDCRSCSQSFPQDHTTNPSDDVRFLTGLRSIRQLGRNLSNTGLSTAVGARPTARRVERRIHVLSKRPVQAIELQCPRPRTSVLHPLLCLVVVVPQLCLIDVHKNTWPRVAIQSHAAKLQRNAVRGSSLALSCSA